MESRYLDDLIVGALGADPHGSGSGAAYVVYGHAGQNFGANNIVDLSAYPTKEAARNSHDFRPLGLGYANLGTLLMLLGLPYDSSEGRAMAAALTAIMCGRAYAVSAEMAATRRPDAPRTCRSTLVWRQEGHLVARADASFTSLSAALEAKLMARQYDQAPADGAQLSA